MTNEPANVKPKRTAAKPRTSSRKRRSVMNTDRLKTTLVVGGLLATYLGADLLASSDAAPAAAESQQVAQVIEIPGSTAAEGFTIKLDPIIDVVSADQIPKPVAKSRSSQ